MSLSDAMQKVCDDSKKIAATCRACGIKDTTVCKQRDCDNFIELIAQLVLVRGLTEKGLLKRA